MVEISVKRGVANLIDLSPASDLGRYRITAFTNLDKDPHVMFETYARSEEGFYVLYKIDWTRVPRGSIAVRDEFDRVKMGEANSKEVDLMLHNAVLDYARLNNYKNGKLEDFTRHAKKDSLVEKSAS